MCGGRTFYATRKAARIIGLIWMGLCAVLWLYVGVFAPAPEIAASWPSWTAARMLADTRFGLTFLPILLAIPGAYVWQWGKRTQGDPSLD